MTHESESDLEDRLEELLTDHFGPANVHRQYIFSESRRRVDFLVDAGLRPTVIEVESRSSELIAGLGQVLEYAAYDDCYAPLLVVADDHELEQPELSHVEQYVPVLTESDLQDRLTDTGGEGDD